MSDIAPSERLSRVLANQPVDRAPVICTGGMMNAAVTQVMDENGPTLPAAHFDAEGMAELAQRVHAATGFENLGVPFCMTVEPEILGSRIDPGTLSCEPKIAEEAFASCGAVEIRDVKKIIREGRIATVVQAAHHLKKRNPDTPVIASLSGPVSTAASVVTPLTFLKELRTRPQDAHRVLDYVTRLLVEYAREVIDNGADVIAIGDPTATGEILGPRIFEDFAVRYINQVCDAVHANGKQVIVHICGDMSKSRNQLAAIHADAISVDALVNLKQLKADFPQINTMGNVSTSLLEFGDAEKVSRNTARLVRDGIDIISPACGLSTSTGLHNIRALTETVKGNA
ncbi:methylcobamide--CoM methyltransferase [Rhodoblastus sphagnicola]|uniref:Methylcobamide--CoM methyltransferase n=1 Tax=Rhodoblastus sphagnicola TaxID=333368 RepID=A0A2S6MTZ1_9HYPH|nr:uroporphyrinogen decarboxylase family protein [Rhodoblastus sphagnicola]MBB4199770.1 [methyl-Co(III) methanol-specific corrinoid protein]:coenzyme M methyltransferase [Rhodoblastus sphagnicola]PPQ25831.1 methylcobamide--CoM methyltransferase [Rhodoblastus sphagnicola]